MSGKRAARFARNIEWPALARDRCHRRRSGGTYRQSIEAPPANAWRSFPIRRGAFDCLISQGFFSNARGVLPRGFDVGKWRRTFR
jgi:hypothetical protein